MVLSSAHTKRLWEKYDKSNTGHLSRKDARSFLKDYAAALKVRAHQRTASTATPTTTTRYMLPANESRSAHSAGPIGIPNTIAHTLS